MHEIDDLQTPQLQDTSAQRPLSPGRPETTPPATSLGGADRGKEGKKPTTTVALLAVTTYPQKPLVAEDPNEAVGRGRLRVTDLGVTPLLLP